MSLATIAPPPAVSRPASAKLLEPGSSLSDQAPEVGRIAAVSPASSAARRRRSTSELGGMGAALDRLPSSAESAGVDSGQKKASEAGPNASRMAARLLTKFPELSCRSSVIAYVMRRQSSGSHGFGRVRRTAYSHGAAPRAARPPFTPSA